MLEPSVIVFYVNNLALSQHFYQELLGIPSKQLSPTYAVFKFENGVIIGLKEKAEQEINLTGNGAVELAFTAEHHAEVEKLFLTWQKKEITILEPPTQVSYGFTFVAADPDGNRLRVITLTEENNYVKTSNV